MEQLKAILPHKDNLLTMTTLKYILTPQEEETAMAYAKKQYISGHSLKMAALNCDPDKMDWDKILDKEGLLQRCNQNKHRAIEDKAFQEKEKAAAKKQREQLIKLWDAGKFYHFLKDNVNEAGTDLIYNDTTEKIIKTWCYFLSKDIRFETELGYSLSKGLLFRGPCGLGKSFVPKMLSNNQLSPIKILSMLDICDEVKGTGEFNVGGFHILKLDDVGTEQNEVKYYGTVINWFKEFMEKFYLHNPSQYNKLVFSTNCSFAELQDKYGFRFRDRIKEMFNIIKVEGESLR